MHPLPSNEVPGGPQLRTWRTTTAIRVFALALATGNAISGGTVGDVFPLLLVLAIVAAASSLLEWSSRNRLTHWHSVAEAVAVTIIIVGTSSSSSPVAYLAVPPVVAGVRHGLVTTLNVTLLSAMTAAATFALEPDGDALEGAAACAPWLAIGLGVGLLASWQDRKSVV